ncbi:MAG: amidase, partial [Chloroflexi bacterium]
MRRLSIPVLAVGVLIALVGCSSASTAAPSTAASAAAPSAARSAAASAPAAGGAAVTIKDFAFNPQTIQAKVGDTITWTNNDSTAHTVTLDDKSVDSGSVAPSATFNHAFTQAGTFTYHCEIHKQMTATITV